MGLERSAKYAKFVEDKFDGTLILRYFFQPGYALDASLSLPKEEKSRNISIAGGALTELMKLPIYILPLERALSLCYYLFTDNNLNSVLH